MTMLFNAGVNRKLVKEFMGHTSDAVDQYQIASDDQISNIIGGRQMSIECPISVKPINNKKDEKKMIEIEVRNKKDSNEFNCSCM